MAVTVEEGLRIIYESVEAKSTELVSLESALGRILAHELVAHHNLPPYDNSAMDGYAVACSDAGGRIKVAHTILAGDHEDHKIVRGSGMKIMTGAKVPQGCEAVVPQEECSVETKGVRLPENIRPGQHIRLCGEDIQSGDLLLPAGTRLHAHQLTLLASQGISHVSVYQNPRVAVFASGSELKMHFETLQAHQLYNTNSPTFLSRARELGCDVTFIGTALDSLKSIEECIHAALGFDLIITSGGVSVGEADFTKEAFNAFGFETLFDKVHIKPGKPTTFGRIGKTYVLNLPGNPMAAALNFELFAQSIILKLSGTRSRFLNPLHVSMKNDYALKSGRRTLIPGYYDGAAFEPIAKIAPGMITPLARANGWVMIDESVSLLEAGHTVKMIPLQHSFTADEPQDLVTR